MTKIWLTGMAAFAFLAGVGIAPMTGTAYAADPPSMGCGPGAKIDGSTAADAKKKMTAAGYTEIKELKKGCDNFWHGRAMKDGKPTGVMLTPEGSVQSEWLDE